jgi:hypothetical protein
MPEDVTWPHKGSAIYLRPAFKQKLAAFYEASQFRRLTL